MKAIAGLLACFAIALAPCAQAQGTKEGAKPQPSLKDTKSGLLAKPEIRADARNEDCKRQAASQNLTGEKLENFMTRCLK